MDASHPTGWPTPLAVEGVTPDSTQQVGMNHLPKETQIRLGVSAMVLLLRRYLCSGRANSDNDCDP